MVSLKGDPFRLSSITQPFQKNKIDQKNNQQHEKETNINDKQTPSSYVTTESPPFNIDEMTGVILFVGIFGYSDDTNIEIITETKEQEPAAQKQHHSIPLCNLLHCSGAGPPFDVSSFLRYVLNDLGKYFQKESCSVLIHPIFGRICAKSYNHRLYVVLTNEEYPISLASEVVDVLGNVYVALDCKKIESSENTNNSSIIRKMDGSQNSDTPIATTTGNQMNQNWLQSFFQRQKSRILNSAVGSSMRLQSPNESDESSPSSSIPSKEDVHFDIDSYVESVFNEFATFTEGKWARECLLKSMVVCKEMDEKIDRILTLEMDETLSGENDEQKESSIHTSTSNGDLSYASSINESNVLLSKTDNNPIDEVKEIGAEGNIDEFVDQPQIYPNNINIPLQSPNPTMSQTDGHKSNTTIMRASTITSSNRNSIFNRNRSKISIKSPPPPLTPKQKLSKAILDDSRKFKRLTRTIINEKGELVTKVGGILGVASIAIFAVPALIFAGPEVAVLSVIAGEAIETSALALACGALYGLTTAKLEESWFWRQEFVSVQVPVV